MVNRVSRRIAKKISEVPEDGPMVLQISLKSGSGSSSRAKRHSSLLGLSLLLLNSSDIPKFQDDSSEDYIGSESVKK